MPDALASPLGGPAQDGSAVRQMLRLACASELLLVPIDAVREILELGALTQVPQTPGFMRGVMNLRGSVIPVIDLSARFGLGATPVNRRTAIVVVTVPVDEGEQPLTLGMLVHAVYEVLDVAQSSIEAVPSLGMVVPPQFVSGMVNVRDRYACLLNLAQTLSPADLTRLIGESAGS